MADPTLSLAEIDAAAGATATLVRETPAWAWRDELVERLFPAGTRPVLKLELFQHAGSFKARGALSVMLALEPAALARGVTAVSAGNHAIAVAWAARSLGTSAKVVMFKGADPLRVARSRALGAEVVLAADVHAAFGEAERIERDEGRSFVHPFEGPRTALGTATLGRELLRQAPDLDAVVVPIGGGGLAGGLAAAIKLTRPECLVLGVEPFGNDTMLRSLRSGRPEQAPAGGSRTIADSLSPPYALPYSFGLCRRYLDDVVLVDDDALREALALLFRSARLAVEPAGAAATAALLGPLRERLAGKQVGLIVCGTNIAAERYQEHLARGTELLERRLQG
ncbi:MAG TPA: pyridoxal-phosphate dependent enzyme [Gemmatimonadales bacterium]|jgi:threonine dehydratase|nr:pyridoxal-phosphate dependent enzyme [Gemmatimonadales bacterium]